MTKRNVLLVVLLVLVVVLWAAAMVQTHYLEKDLEELARIKVRDFKNEYGRKGAKDYIRIGSRVAASRAFLIFGKPAGKVSVFVERPVANRTENLIETFEFFYERSQDGWRQTESGRCTSELCTLEGKKVLDAL